MCPTEKLVQPLAPQLDPDVRRPPGQQADPLQRRVQHVLRKIPRAEDVKIDTDRLVRVGGEGPERKIAYVGKSTRIGLGGIRIRKSPHVGCRGIHGRRLRLNEFQSIKSCSENLRPELKKIWLGQNSTDASGIGFPAPSSTVTSQVAVRRMGTVTCITGLFN